MLERLRISDLAIVERAEARFGEGLNVVTGETGAGKTLLVQAVSLLVGERPDADSVREGASSAVVEGEFRVGSSTARRVAELMTEWGIDFDGETVILRRDVQAGGRSRATINQSPVTIATLKRLGDIMADLHGQHEHQSLLSADSGRDVLDRLGGLEALRERYLRARAHWLESQEALDGFEAEQATHAERRDWMLAAAAELDQAKLVVGEDEDLRGEAARLTHADRLRELIGQAIERLSEGESPAVGSLVTAAQKIEQAVTLDPTLAEHLSPLEEARIAASESARALAAYASTLETDSQRLEAVEVRRELMTRLTRKYRRSTAELIAWRETLREDLASGEDLEHALAERRERLDRDQTECQAAGKALFTARRATAAVWNTKLSRELRPLGLPHGRLEFEVAASPDPGPPFPPQGLDRVELAFTANPGEPLRPLQRIASGGEISRVMLTLKAALEAQDSVDVLIFDEVDSGIGGAVAQAVGERLQRLARHRQIICITHLPMIAALGAHHLRVVKRAVGGRTTVQIEPLELETRIEELARMLAGDRVTPTTRRQARELLGGLMPGSVSR